MKFLAPQTLGALTTVLVDGVRCRSHGSRPGWVGKRERTYLSNKYVKRDFMFSRLELTG